MKNINLKPFIFILLVFSGVVWFGIASASGLNMQSFIDFMRPIPKVVTADLLLVGVFMKWGWRWKRLQGWLIPFPDLNGTWEGHIQTNWKDMNGNTPGPIPVILSIKQSFTRLSCVMRTAEMESHSYTEGFCIDKDAQVRRLCYSYMSRPKTALRDRASFILSMHMRNRDSEEPDALIALVRICGGAVGQPAALPGLAYRRQVSRQPLTIQHQSNKLTTTPVTQTLRSPAPSPPEGASFLTPASESGRQLCTTARGELAQFIASRQRIALFPEASVRRSLCRFRGPGMLRSRTEPQNPERGNPPRLSTCVPFGTVICSNPF